MSRTNEPFVNTELLELVRQAKLEELGAVDLDVDAKEQEDARYLSELYRIILNYDEDELIVTAAALLARDDTVYPRVQIAERKSLRKGKSNGKTD